MWIADEEAHLKIAKLCQLRTRSGSRDILFNFRNPSISEERLKIQTSNLSCRLITRGTIQKFAKLGQMGRRPGSRDPPLYLRNGWRCKVRIWYVDCRRGGISKNCKIRSTGNPIWVTWHTFKFRDAFYIWWTACVRAIVRITHRKQHKSFYCETLYSALAALTSLGHVTPLYFLAPSISVLWTTVHR